MLCMFSHFQAISSVSGVGGGHASCLAPRFRVLFGGRVRSGAAVAPRRGAPCIIQTATTRAAPRILLASRPTDVSNYMLS